MKKSTFQSVVCLMLAVLMLVSLAACGAEPVPPMGGDTPNGGGSSLPDLPDLPDLPEEPDGGNENENPPVVESTVFSVENLKKAKIVYPAKTYALGGKVELAIDSLITSIKTRFGCTLEKTTDKQGTTESEYEILIGETNRKESKETLADLLQGDYGYKINGKKIIIKGGSQEAILEGIKTFQSKVVSARYDQKIFYESSLDAITRQNRAGKDLVINGTHISEFTIVYPSTSNEFEKELARRLSDYIALLSGHILTFQTDSNKETAHEILIGKTKRNFTILTKEGAAVEADANHIAIVGANAYDFGLAQEALSDLIKAAVVAKQPLTLPDKTPVSAEEKVSLMAYNVYGLDHYATRCDNICRLVTKYLPDILGYQEPDVAMTNKIRMSDYYEWFDGKERQTRPDGTLEGDKLLGANSISPIGYAKDRYEFILGDTKWCTPTPDYPSKEPEAPHYRMYTYVMLRDKVTGEEFIVVNHHLQGDLATSQLTYMFKFFQANYTDIPVIMLGDFNREVGTEAIQRVVMKDGGFTSLHQMTNNPEAKNPARIDWIFAMSCCVKGVYYKWCQETYPDMQARPDERYGDGKTPSDHSPVYAELIIKSDRAEHTHDWSKLASEVSFKTEPTVPERVK